MNCTASKYSGVVSLIPTTLFHRFFERATWLMTPTAAPTTRILPSSMSEMWWCLTDDGLQRLTQSPGETSSSLTDDGLDDGGSL